MTVIAFSARRSQRVRERIGLDRPDRLGQIDADLRQIEQALAALAARKTGVLREYRRELRRSLDAKATTG
jgi:hypothetical protein